MALLNIVKEGEPILRKVCRPVTEITPRILQLLDDIGNDCLFGVQICAHALRTSCPVQNKETLACRRKGTKHFTYTSAGGTNPLHLAIPAVYGTGFFETGRQLNINRPGCQESEARKRHAALK